MDIETHMTHVYKYRKTVVAFHSWPWQRRVSAAGRRLRVRDVNCKADQLSQVIRQSITSVFNIVNLDGR